MIQVNQKESIFNTAACYATIVVILLTAIYYYLKNKGIPPGPVGLPYFGYWPFLKTNTCHLQLQEFGKKYGSVFSFSATGRLYVNLGSIKSNREAFVQKSECFNQRINGFTLANRLFRGSIVVQDGEEWKTNRKFFAQQFRERGIANIKGQLCGPIYDGIKQTIEDLRRKNGAPTDVVDMLMSKCTRILFQTCFGESGISEQEIMDLNQAYTGIVQNINGPLMLPCGTFAKYFIFPFLKNFQNIIKSVTVMEKMLYNIINRHKETFDENNVRNIIDAYYKEKVDRLSKQDPTAHYLTDFVLVGSLVQFIGDGVLAVAAFIGVFLYALIEHPEDQEKIYKELMEVVGSDRDPTMEDKNKFLYTNAFISELLRTSNAFPFFPKMECSKETTIDGYKIPKGAAILVNIWLAHSDPEVYEEPAKFNPSRFLTVEGKKKPEQPMLFGIGKHSCLGEGFTMAQVFLFMTTILKHFHLTAPKDTKDSDFLFFHGKMVICAQPRKVS